MSALANKITHRPVVWVHTRLCWSFSHYVPISGCWSLVPRLLGYNTWSSAVVLIVGVCGTLKSQGPAQGRVGVGRRKGRMLELIQKGHSLASLPVRSLLSDPARYERAAPHPHSCSSAICPHVSKLYPRTWNQNRPSSHRLPFVRK